MKVYKNYVFLIILTILCVLLWKAEVLNIKKIVIEKNSAPCVDDQKLLSELKIKGELILLIDENNINKYILSKNICVKNIVLEKKIPDTVKIIINGRKGVARTVSFKNNLSINLKQLEATDSSQAALIDWSLPVSDSTDNFTVDDEGIVFAKNDENSLPFLYISDQMIQIGNKIKNIDFSKVALIFIKLPQMNINITQTKIIEHNLQILGENKIIISLEKDILKQLASLQLILEKARIDNRTMEMIDLRFDKPVVKYVLKK